MNTISQKEQAYQNNYTTGDRKFYTPEEVREQVFGAMISKPLLYAALRRGEIANIRLGSKILVPAWWVERALAKPEPEGGQGELTK
ncbi:hypothetical protein [Anaerospora hongkongensis]|uniref:hypothetical protein n=1 Tax=Anaerospora hongkongensis TaxID=244830 RepID=UPI0028998D5F|nr:hypothetical protein [Anaerospora hongkongensis]